MSHASNLRTFLSKLSVFVVAMGLACAATLALSSPAQAAETEIEFTNIGFGGEVGVYATPGEKFTLKANTYTVDDEWNRTNINDVTYTWTANAKLKATSKGAKLTIAKVPKVGKYSVKVVAKDTDGNTLAKKSFKLVVKKKPALKVKVTKMGGTKNLSSVKKGDSIGISMQGASWGWDNNTKGTAKYFYTWTVKKVGGKTATWNAKKGVFKSNAFIAGSSVAGGDVPYFMGSFKQKGKYQITATVYHSNKKIATAKKTITVK
ncbi:MAG: hypothetical protein Q4D27_05885 [Coriobacteriia bacterium]|nr:hypothetical protein [Coriobacteriia bacterium]